jgi:hypothetical protein
MVRIYRWIGLGVLLALGMTPCPAPADGAKPDNTNKIDAKDLKKDKIKNHFTAKLLRVEGVQRNLTVEVRWKIPQQNAQAALNIANLQRQLLTNRDPNQIANIRLDMARNQQNLVSYKDEVQKVELEAPDELKVRTLLTPVEYDDKGKVKRLTDKEKKALRGPDTTLPGYTADFDSLKADQQIEVYLDKSATASTPKTKGKESASQVKRYKATMIVILAEPQK